MSDTVFVQRPARVEAFPCKARDLKPGMLFSTHGPEYWDTALDKGSIGELTYIRTHQPAAFAPDADADVFELRVTPAGADHAYVSGYEGCAECGEDHGDDDGDGPF